MRNTDGSFNRIMATRAGHSPIHVCFWLLRHAEGGTAIFRRIAEKAAELLTVHWQVVDALKSDPNLSKRGADQQMHSAALKSLSGIRGLVEHTEQEKRGVESRYAQLYGQAIGSKRAKDDVTGTMIDIELARAIKEMGPSERAILLSRAGDTDLLRVALHLPGVLTGISAEERETITQQLIERYNPAELETITELRAAAASAAEALRTLYNTFGEGMTPAERAAAAPALATYFEPPVNPAEALARARDEVAA